MKGKVIAFYSPIGGAGVTVMTTQVGFGLAQKAQVLAFDANLEFGICADALNLKSAPGTIEKYDDKFCAFSSPLLTAQQSTRENPFDAVGTIVELRSSYDYLLVDLPHLLYLPHVIPTMEKADQIFIVGNFHLQHMSRQMRFLRWLQSDRALAAKSKLVINKYDGSRYLLQWQCKKELDGTAFENYETFDWDPKGVKWSLNQGTMAPAHTKVGKSAQRLVNVITGGNTSR